MTGIITIFEQMKEHLSLFLLILILLLVLYTYISQDKKVYLSVVYFISGMATMRFSHLSSNIRLRTFILWSRIILDYRFSMSLPNYKVNIRFSPIYSVLYVILVCTFFMNVMVGVSDVFLSKLDLTKQYSYLVEQEKKEISILCFQIYHIVIQQNIQLILIIYRM